MESFTPTYATSSIVISADKVLCVWHKKLNGWMLPGGKQEPGELPLDTHRRELYEETGIRSLKERLVFSAPSLLVSDLLVHTYVVLEWENTYKGAEEGSKIAWSVLTNFLHKTPARASYERMILNLLLNKDRP